MNDFTIKGSLVKDHINQRSYNLTSKIDAIKLHETLTEYENTITNLEKQINTDKNYKEIQQQLISLQMDISNAQSDLNKIKELLQC